MSRAASTERISVHVKNLPLDATDHEVRQRFQEFGSIKDVYIPKDLTTREPRGFCFVEFDNRESAERSIKALDGTDFKGRPLVVCMAHQKRKTPDEMRRLSGPPPSSRGRSRSPPRRRDRSRDRSRRRSRSGDRQRRRSPSPRRDRSRDRRS